jgi:two-component system sensor histidine kinase RegB
MLFYTSLPPVHNHYGGDFNVHVIGMWINFLLSAVLMSIFVAAIAGAVRQRDRFLARAREKALADEKIVALGTLASGVAHEISTPLSTMTLLTDDMLDQARDNPVLKQDIELLRKQITVCRHGIATLLDRTGHARSEHARALDLVEFIREILGQWQTIRPEIELETDFEQPFDSPSIVAEQTIAQAITNLLNNAADASVENDSNFVRLRIASHNKHLSICIDDNGPGFSAHHSEQTASAVVSTKEDGFGIGLILSNATISRFGGEVHLHKRDQGGTRTEILLPLNRLVLS